MFYGLFNDVLLSLKTNLKNRYLIFEMLNVNVRKREENSEYFKFANKLYLFIILKTQNQYEL